MILETEEAARKALRAKVTYSIEKVSPFEGGNPGTHTEREVAPTTRDSATDKQIKTLIGLGYPLEKAHKCSRRQASAVIDNLMEKTCTAKQRALLMSHGRYRQGMNFYDAKDAIDQLATEKGWQRRL